LARELIDDVADVVFAQAQMADWREEIEQRDDETKPTTLLC
jgi:poly-gamma-glutamate capsule biosynthesis protein CapA/YwtB (metallophosphatase superfamily)